MAAYVSGDRRAFEQLFSRLAPRLHRFFRRSFSAEATADDLLQVTFLKLHKARDTYRADMRVAPWAFTIAARVRLDEFRRRKRLAEDGDEEALARAEETQAKTQSETSSHRETIDGDTAEAVRRAVDGLPESQRVVIHLNRFEEMTFAEIAKVLGTTEGAVKLRAFRAYGALRQVLQPMLAEVTS
ncbi:MAG TPA: RNA polymerase sigma factor [Polyangia bacterium]|nr:RNA polymerase sigma factor [Polyangia bacterium]